MKILTRQGIIQTELFREIMRHEQLGIITFSYGYVYDEDRCEGPTYIVQVPMSFGSDRDCLEAFRRYLRARNEGHDCVSFLDLHCKCPKDTYRKVVHHKALQLLEL
jgi:hypothetical protein